MANYGAPTWLIGDVDSSSADSWLSLAPDTGAAMAAKMLCVSTAGGRQFDVELEEGETTATLKKKLFELIREAQQ